MNYETVKDAIFVEVVNTKLNSLDLSQVRTVILKLAKIYKKRHYQLFKIIETNPELVPRVAGAYLKYF